MANGVMQSHFYVVQSRCSVMQGDCSALIFTFHNNIFNKHGYYLAPKEDSLRLST